MLAITQLAVWEKRWGWYVTDPRVGLLGATSLVGKCLISLLAQRGSRVYAFSRQSIEPVGDGITWCNLSETCSANTSQLDHWICVAPIWVLPEHFPLLEAAGAHRVVALSSTSRFTKDDSTDPEEQAVALRLADAESRLQTWAESRGVEWIILRPTLIYGLGRDKNIAEIARFIRRFGFFPLFGQARGLRQPIHSEDVAAVCIEALHAKDAANRAYNISGGETLTYRDMVARVFAALDQRPRLLTVPLYAFRLTVTVLRRLPRYQQWSTAMAERMNRDLVFDHAEAARDLGFKPRSFALTAKDLPR